MSVARAWLTVGLLACVTACASDKPRPRTSARSVAPPTVGLQDLGTALPEIAPKQLQSRVGATLTLPLATLRALIDREVPATLEQDWQRLTRRGASPEVDARYVVERLPVVVTVEGSAIRVELPVSYHAELRGRIRVPIVRRWLPLAGDLTWGTPRKPQRVTLAVTLEVGLAPDYALVVKAAPLPPVHGPPPEGKACVKAIIKLCMAKKQLAPRVRELIDRQVMPRLVAAIEKLKKRLARQLDTRRQIREMWATAGCPWSMRSGAPVCAKPEGDPDDLWLHFVPQRVGIGAPRLSAGESANETRKTRQNRSGKGDHTLELDLDMQGVATLVAGPWPGVEVTPLPSPTAGAKQGFLVAVQAQLPYAVIAAAATAALVGRSVKVGRRGVLEITRVELDGRAGPDGTPMLLLELHVDGAARGIVHLWGRPTYDAQTETLRLVDLDYTVESRNRFVNKLEAINHDRFRAGLQSQAVFELGPRISQLRSALQGVLTRELGSGVRMVGTVQGLSAKQPLLSSDRMLLPLRLDGLVRVVPQL